MSNNNDMYREDTIREEDFEELYYRLFQNRRTRRRKKNNKGKAIAIAAVIAATAVSYAIISHAIDNSEDLHRATKLTGAYQKESYCIIPDRIFTSQNHDFVYTSGEHLTEAADKKNIDILKVGDFFITEDGSRVARVFLEIETVESKDIIRCEVDGQEFYIEPEGYVWNNHTKKCERVTTEVIEKYVYANENHDYTNIRVPGSKIISVISFEEHPSISYETAKGMKVIADVEDEYVNNDANVVTIARLEFVPNNQN